MIVVSDSALPPHLGGSRCRNAKYRILTEASDSASHDGMDTLTWLHITEDIRNHVPELKSGGQDEGAALFLPCW